LIVVTAAEMRALDRWTIEHGTPGAVLMERAGVGATRLLRARLGRSRRPVVIVCGRGNNGGDGFVIARHLRRARIPVEVWLAAKPEEVRGDAAGMLEAWRRLRGAVEDLSAPDRVPVFVARLAGAGAVVDAIFGTGLNAPVTGVAATVIEAINASGRLVLAVDIASGLSADTGMPHGTAVCADVTASFAFAKVGQTLYPGVDHTGDLHVVDIGVPGEAVAAVGPRVTLLEEAQVGQLVKRRPRDGHKGTFGHVLVIAGSRGKTGAALLATGAAGRAGAGLVTLAVAAGLQPTLEAYVRESMTAALPDAGHGVAALDDGRAVDALLDGRDAVVCGPGLGLADPTRTLVAHIVRRCRVPLVLDADGLNAVAGTDLLAERGGQTIVTPHPGEMARLIESDTRAVQADRPGVARTFAARAQVVVVLKGARTIVAAPDGTVAICPTGNPGMATGGTGDVLAGLLGGLLAQGLAPFEAAVLGVFAHGAAGDAVAARRGEMGLLAGDLIDELPPTFARLYEAAHAPETPPRRRSRARS
jgi:ADP-dependent NAD(P)H-hydrate dehydratase / NAD(P)H-hydrate epimerase